MAEIGLPRTLAIPPYSPSFLHLQRTQEGDEQMVYELVTHQDNRDHIGTFQPWALHYTLEEACGDVQNRLTDMRTEAGMQYHLLRSGDQGQEYLGDFTLFERKAATIKLGYFLAEHATGHGYATQASEVLIRQAQAKWPSLRRLLLQIDPYNEASQNVATRLGAHNTGRKYTIGEPTKFEHVEIWERNL